jgi:hypothetical protein
MNGTPAGPKCPRCRRKLAAWRLDHCIYCGEKFPENIREGFTEPEALKFVDAALALLTLPVFAAIFYMLYRLVSRAFPSFAVVIVVAALLVLGYVGWNVAKSAR